MIVMQTPAGNLRWDNGNVHGDTAALLALHAPRPGKFGLIPDQVDYSDALERSDSFIDLVLTIWPDATVLKDSEAEEESSPRLLY